jgi:formiminoglutamate deiminase
LSTNHALHFATALTPDGWVRDLRVVVAGGLIASASPDTPPEPADERHAIGLPGLANLHSHAFQRGMAGLAEFPGPTTDTFWTWREVMYRFALSLTPEDAEAVAAQAYVEMLEHGFTRVGEFHYLHHDLDGQPYGNVGEMAERIAAAAAGSGIGLTLLPVFYAHSNFGGLAPTAGQRRFISGLDTFARLLEASRAAVADVDGANVGVAPHSLRAVTPEELDAVSAMAAGGPVHMHIAEQVKEVEDCHAWSGARPVEWLLDHADVGRRWCLIHATHMNPVETAALAQTGAVAGLCPVTEANLGDGVFPAPSFMASGGRFGIGTDSNVRIGVADEMRQLEYAQRLRDRARNVMTTPGKSTGRCLFDSALAGGGAALGAASTGITAGAAADMVSLDADHPALVSRAGDALLDSWIFAAAPGTVDCVWTHGTKRVSAGRHPNRESVRARFAASMQRLQASAAGS